MSSIKSLCEEVIVVFILNNVITLVCNGFLITQLLPSWATCCSKLVPMGLDCAPLFLPAQIRHPWRTSTKRDFLDCLPVLLSFILHTYNLSFMRQHKAFYIQFMKWRRCVDGVWLVWIGNASSYQPDTSLPGSAFIVLELRLVVADQIRWDVKFHNSIMTLSILFLLTGTQSWRWKSSCPALQLLQTRW